MKEKKMNCKPSTNHLTAFVVLFCAFVVLDPTNAHAAGNPIVSVMEWVEELLTSGLARSAAIVAVAVLGYCAWYGHMTGEKAIRFIAGIIFVFGGAALVDLISSAVG